MEGKNVQDLPEMVPYVRRSQCANFFLYPDKTKIKTEIIIERNVGNDQICLNESIRS